MEVSPAMIWFISSSFLAVARSIFAFSCSPSAVSRGNRGQTVCRPILLVELFSSIATRLTLFPLRLETLLALKTPDGAIVMAVVFHL